MGGDTYVLLHQFRKKTRKTPQREIEKAKAERHNLDLSQRDLAELCGLPHSSVARIESGKSSPNLSTLLKIFRQLGLNFSVYPVTPGK